MGFRNSLLKRGIISSDTEVLINALACIRQGTPPAMTTAATISVESMLSGIITGTHAVGATQAYTLPLGADMDDGLTSYMVNDASFDITIINLSPADADTITLTANTGFTIVGQPIVDANEWEVAWYPNYGTFRCRKVDTDTFVAYRIA